MLLILSGSYDNCLENRDCSKLKEKFYGKNRVDLSKLESLFTNLNVVKITEALEIYKSKCKSNIANDDVLYLLLKLLKGF